MYGVGRSNTRPISACISRRSMKAVSFKASAVASFSLTPPILSMRAITLSIPCTSTLISIHHLPQLATLNRANDGVLARGRFQPRDRAEVRFLLGLGGPRVHDQPCTAMHASEVI